MPDNSYIYNAMKSIDFDMNNKAHRFYQTMMKLCPDANVFQYNHMCETAGIKPWTKERKQTKRYAKKDKNNMSIAS